jgi:hypothetical protein
MMPRVSTQGAASAALSVRGDIARNLMAYISAMLRTKYMKVDVSTELNCSAIKAWNEVQKSSLLLHVIWPLARIVFVDGRSFPER